MREPIQSGRARIAVEFDKSAKLALAGCVDPQSRPRYRPDNVSSARIRRVTAMTATAIRPERDRLRGTRRNNSGALSSNPIAHNRGGPAKRLLRVAAENDFSVPTPSNNQRIGSQIGQPPRSPPSRHHIHFHAAFIAPAERQPLPLKRQRRMTRRPQPRPSAARDSAPRGHRPQIILADEHDRVVVNCRKAIIALSFHEVERSYTERDFVVEAQSHPETISSRTSMA